MGITTRGRTALSTTRFPVGFLDGMLPLSLVTRIAPIPEYGPPKARPEGLEAEMTDIAVALVRGYDKNPELFESWTGTGMGSLVTHVSDTLGDDHVLHGLFGLARGIESIIQVKSFEQVAGAARLAVYGAELSDIPPMNEKSGTKYVAEHTPPRNQCADLATELLRQTFSWHDVLIPMLGDLTTPEKHALLSGLSGVAVGNLGPLVRVVYAAGQEGLPVGRVLQVWKLVGSDDAELVLDAVRGSIPDEYLLEVQATPRRDPGEARW